MVAGPLLRASISIVTIAIHPVTFQKIDTTIRIGGCSLADLARDYGTPLYVIDEKTLRTNAQIFTHALSTHYSNYTVAYASKAGINVGLAAMMASENIGADVVSGGELETVLRGGIPSHAIYFHGNNKSSADVQKAIHHNVCIMVDNPTEWDRIQAVSQSLNARPRLMIRITPGIEAHTHEYIKTGHIDSKFGVPFNTALAMIEGLKNNEWCEFEGIHAHIGSQIFDEQPFYDLVDGLIDAMATIRSRTGFECRKINPGGGFGIQYMDTDAGMHIATVIKGMAERIKTQCHHRGLSLPHLVFEPGRSIMGNAGVTLYSVGATKAVEGGSHYVFVDGGMGDNPRPMMYQSKHTVDVISSSNHDGSTTYTIAGKYCESGDILVSDVLLPTVAPGDVVVVYGTGAYNYSMASNYNRFCRPAMVVVGDGAARVLVRRETIEDVIRYDVMP